MAGFIYIMSNPAFSRIKIGKSTKDPTKDRASELYQTGVPEPMKVEYFALVEDENLLERLVHQHFHASRPNKGREFFDLDVPTAIKGIRELAAERSPILHEKVFHVYDDCWDEDPLDEDPLDEETEDDWNVGLSGSNAEDDIKVEKTRDDVLEKPQSMIQVAVSFFLATVIIWYVLGLTIGAEETSNLSIPILISSGLICWLFLQKRSTNKKPTPPKQNKGLMHEVRNSFLTTLFWMSVIIISFVLLVY